MLLTPKVIVEVPMNDRQVIISVTVTYALLMALLFRSLWLAVMGGLVLLAGAVESTLHRR